MRSKSKKEAGRNKQRNKPDAHKLATLQAEKESSTVLHEDEIQSYKFDLEHIQEDYKLLGATKDDLKSSIALHKDLLSLNQQKEKIAMDIKIALVNISDLQQWKEVMCNEIKNYSQDLQFAN